VLDLRAISDKGMQNAKWLAIVLMVLDHINAYICYQRYPWMHQVSRLVMPIFALIIAANLCRDNDVSLTGRAGRVLKRLLVFGCLAAIPAYFLFRQNHWTIQANVLLGYAVGILLVYGVQRASQLWPSHSVLVSLMVGITTCAFFFLGLYLEFLWFAPLLVLLGWGWYGRGKWSEFCGIQIFFVLGVSGYMLAQNVITLLAPCIIIGAGLLPFTLPRISKFFYWFYPVHLAVIELITLVR